MVESLAKAITELHEPLDFIRGRFIFNARALAEIPETGEINPLVAFGGGHASNPCVVCYDVFSVCICYV